MKTEKITIRGESIRLCDLLKFASLAPTGGGAKIVIEQGEVTVNGEVCTQKGRKLRDGDRVVFDRTELEVCCENRVV